MKGELENWTVNYDKKTEAYVTIWARSVSYQKIFFKIGVLKISQIPLENACVAVLETLFNKFAILKALIVWDFNTGVSLWNV